MSNKRSPKKETKPVSEKLGRQEYEQQLEKRRVGLSGGGPAKY